MAKSNSHTGVITPSKTPALKRIGQSISVTTHKCYNKTINNSVNCTPRFLCVVTFFFFFFSSQRSISFRTDAQAFPQPLLRNQQKASSFPRRRSSQCWSDTVESHELTAKEIRRQEVVTLIILLILFMTVDVNKLLS